MPIAAILVMVLLAAAQVPTLPYARDAFALGRTHDAALIAAFNKGYSLSPADTIESAEIVTEFRRAVMLVRERALLGNYSFTELDLTGAMAPHLGRVGFVVQARLPPLNTFTVPPTYDMYISTGPKSKPIADKGLKREPVYALGPPGGSLVGLRIEATFPKEDIENAAAPELIVINDRAEILWRARIDLSRFR
jgi:hypothetical protein